MEFQEALTIMNYFMNETAEVGYVFGGKKSEIDKTIRFMLKDIDDLSKSVKVDMNPNNLSTVRAGLSILKNNVTETVISTDLSQFIDAYLLLMNNWNNALHKNEDIKADIQLILRYKQLHFTAAELIQNGKHLIQKFKNLSTFALPSIELSKHYLARFKEKVAEKGSDNKAEIHAFKINTPLKKSECELPTQTSEPLVKNVIEERMNLSVKSSGANIQEPGIAEKNISAETQVVETKPVITPSITNSLSKLNFNKKL